MIEYYCPGRLEYSRASKIQTDLQRLRMAGCIGDTLLLLEHPPTLTFTRTGNLKNLLIDEGELARKGIALHSTDRGGDITCHGPGQLVAYPILNLKRMSKDIHRYVHDLQEVIIRTLKDYSVCAGRDGDHVGVWVGSKKIAAMGIHIKRWITKHGFALNINNDLDHFSFIHPCGLIDRGVISLSGLICRTTPLEEVMEKIIEQFSAVFNVPLIKGRHPLVAEYLAPVY